MWISYFPIFFNRIYFFLFCNSGLECRPSHLPGMHSTTELHSSPWPRVSTDNNATVCINCGHALLNNRHTFWETRARWHPPLWVLQCAYINGDSYNVSGQSKGTTIVYVVDCWLKHQCTIIRSLPSFFLPFFVLPSSFVPPSSFLFLFPPCLPSSLLW